MAVQSIESVELYTSDKPSAVDYFVSSLGFTQAAESQTEDRSSALLRQGAAQVIVTAGEGVSAFLDAHGDGIADIALSCADVAGTCAAAIAAGVRVTSSAAGQPTVPGFGDVRHTLLPVPASPGDRLPAGRPWVMSPARLGGPAGRIRLLDHVAVCLEPGTMAGCVDFYLAAFGLTRYSAEYVEIGEQAMDSVVVRSAGGGATFTLLQPDTARRPGQIDAFLGRNGGPGVQHLAFGVDEIIPAVHEFTDRGVEFLRTPGTYYDMLGERLTGMRGEIEGLRAADVLADRDEYGYLLQLFTRSPYERNTLFYELVQRRGARGFGSANIRALYEAVERDRLAAE